jgi:hypothetical protein
MAEPDHLRFGGLTFEDFRRMADDASLSPNERIGFPDSYRAGAEGAILGDILAKLPALGEERKVIVDIGAGCAELSHLLRRACRARGHTLVFVDSAEMLAHHEDGPDLIKVPARFPDCPELLAERRGAVDAILVYSVIQYAFVDASIFDFVDAALELLAPGGRLLIGDIPNASMRKRFLASAAGAEHHRRYTGGDEPPDVSFNVVDRGQIDDAVVLALVSRARAAGFDAWIVPQAPGLPMANRREDLLIHRP